MARYAPQFKDQSIARLLLLESSVAATAAHELGVGIAVLERWRAEALAAPRPKRAPAGVGGLEVVTETASLDETARSACFGCPSNKVDTHLVVG